LGGTDMKEGALNRFFGQADATSTKYTFIAAFILVAIFITLVSVGLNLSDTTFDMALS
jgi:Flp pilus assembly pilin Flp